MTERAYPFPVVHPVYASGFSRYPERVRIPMDDGKVFDYFGDLPKESVMKPALDHFNQTCMIVRKRRKRMWV